MPPLNSLRAFEAAARHESFVRASEELGVSAGAVAQQVKVLENWLGTELFRRSRQGVRLTDDARSCMPKLVRAFDALGAAVDALRETTASAHVRIAALPSIAQLWLGPRLADLQSEFPDLTISVAALEEPPDFRREPYDLGLFFLTDDLPGVACVRMAEDVIRPMCSPGLVSDEHVPLAPSDVCTHVLINDAMWQDDWPAWFATAGLDPAQLLAGPTFSLYGLAVDSAVGGTGLIMGHDVLLDRHLKQGILKAPFGLKATSGRYFMLLIPEHGQDMTPSKTDFVNHVRTVGGG